MDGSFAAFLGVAAVVIVTPGQDTALAIRNTLLGGRSAGIATAVGVALGQATWTLAASLGVGMTLVWLSAYAVVLGRAGHLLARIADPARVRRRDGRGARRLRCSPGGGASLIRGAVTRG